MAATSMSLSAIAEASGISDTTLTRLFNADYKGVLSAAKVQAVSDFSGLAGPGAVVDRQAPFVLREDGVRFVINDKTDATQDAVFALIGDNPNLSPWRLSTDVLHGAGMRPGDVLIVDQAAEARDGDVVCAQIEQGLGARTVFRVMQRPALVGAAVDMTSVRPEFIDGSRVRVAGVVIHSIRSRA